MLDDAVWNGSLFDYYVVEKGVELVEPEESFVEEFVKFLTEELKYPEPEVCYLKEIAVVEINFV
jgi:hypothetical protein